MPFIYTKIEATCFLARCFLGQEKFRPLLLEAEVAAEAAVTGWCEGY